MTHRIAVSIVGAGFRGYLLTDHSSLPMYGVAGKSRYQEGTREQMEEIARQLNEIEQATDGPFLKYEAVPYPPTP